MRIGFVIEQSIYLSWSLILAVMYGAQVKQDFKIEFLLNMTKNNRNFVVLNTLKSVGRTAIILHVGGFIGCIICSIRCIDPFPVLGIYNYAITDGLSHIGIAVVLSTSFEAIGALVSKVYTSLSYTTNHKNLFITVTHIITCVTFVTAIATWVVENFVSDVLMYSAGVYFLYGTTVQWVIYIMYLAVLKQLSSYLKICKRTLPEGQYYILHSMMHKLNIIKYMFTVILLTLTGYQIYTFIQQIKNNTRITIPDKEYYTFPQVPLLTVQIVSYTVLLYFSYIGSNKAGDIGGLSEASTRYSKNIQNGVQLIALDDHQERHEPLSRVITVKFKDDEIDDVKVINPEVIKRSTVHSESSLSDIAAAYAAKDGEISGYDLANGVDLTNDADLAMSRAERILRMYSEQEKAEHEGRIDEYFASKNRLQNKTQPTLSDTLSDSTQLSSETITRVDMSNFIGDETRNEYKLYDIPDDISPYNSVTDSDDSPRHAMRNPTLQTKSQPVSQTTLQTKSQPVSQTTPQDTTNPVLPPFYEDMVPGPGLPSIPSMPNTPAIAYIPSRFETRVQNYNGKSVRGILKRQNEYITLPPSLPSSNTDLTKF